MIGDVDAVSAPLSPAAAADAGAALDQRLCLLRQPSGVHLTYLRNMGVWACGRVGGYVYAKEVARATIEVNGQITVVLRPVDRPLDAT